MIAIRTSWDTLICLESGFTIFIRLSLFSLLKQVCLLVHEFEKLLGYIFDESGITLDLDVALAQRDLELGTHRSVLGFRPYFCIM